MIVLAYVIFTSAAKGLEIYREENLIRLKQSISAGEQTEMLEIKNETRGLLDIPPLNM